MTHIEQLKANRFRFLHKLWEMSKGAEYRWVNMWDLGTTLGLERDETANIMNYLRGEGLAKPQAIGGIIGITHQGIKEIEEALSEPEQPTHYFPPVNIINIANMHGGQIQQASNNSTQTGTFTLGNDLSDLRDLIAAAKADLRKIVSLSGEQRAEAETYIDAVERQTKLTKPNLGFVRSGLESLKAVLEIASGDVVGSVVLGLLKAWLIAHGIPA